MNQTRTFLIFAWLMVATLLWMAWSKEHAAPPVTSPVATAASSTVPGASSANVPALPSVPTAPSAAAMSATPDTLAADSVPTVTVTTDVLRLTLDGGAIHRADLLKYPQSTEAGSAPVRLFADDVEHFFEAQSGWVSSTGAAPTHEAGFVPEASQRDFNLAAGSNALSVPFVWHGANGVSIRRTYTFTRGDYAVGVRDEVINAGSAPWQGYVYRQLLRVPPQVQTGMTHPESYSFHGAA
jgi:YidC/Oxa1 family membrane protein insertase